MKRLISEQARRSPVVHDHAGPTLEGDGIRKLALARLRKANPQLCLGSHRGVSLGPEELCPLRRDGQGKNLTRDLSRLECAVR